MSVDPTETVSAMPQNAEEMRKVEQAWRDTLQRMQAQSSVQNRPIREQAMELLNRKLEKEGIVMSDRAMAVLGEAFDSVIQCIEAELRMRSSRGYAFGPSSASLAGQAGNGGGSSSIFEALGGAGGSGGFASALGKILGR